LNPSASITSFSEAFRPHRQTPFKPEFRMKTLRIMYVEDNTELRDVLAEMLEGPGRAVVAFATGEAALAAWETGAPDLLVTDIGLPGMSGTDLTRIVVAKRPAQWVALCSGYEYGHHIATLGKNVRVLPKPFEFEQLEALIDEVNEALSAS
jgi:two-component system cell cycle response regulator CpdR